MNDSRPPYPVRVDAWLDPSLSRWLWLVKWLLLVSHYVVLAFLWMGFVVVSVIAFFAILITGRYPRALFDFAVGVLRWTWRVHYYGYWALGTDRYPPFTLAEVSDYPARLDVPYPERLSRGLVLVKWWLLALPHYVVLAIFVGGGLWLSSRRGTNNGWINGWGAGGLVGLLVFIAAIVLLFTGRYPRALYDFVMGMDRWVLRVTAYASLMTDRYPPFRLDMRDTDPGSLPVGPTPPMPAGAVAHVPAAPAAATAWPQQVDRGPRGHPGHRRCPAVRSRRHTRGRRDPALGRPHSAGGRLPDDTVRADQHGRLCGDHSELPTRGPGAGLGRRVGAARGHVGQPGHRTVRRGGAQRGRCRVPAWRQLRRPRWSGPRCC